MKAALEQQAKGVVSRGDEIRACSPVHVIDKVSGDATLFTRVHSHTQVRLERA